jgi:hypothetical protein
MFLAHIMDLMDYPDDTDNSEMKTNLKIIGELD